MSNYKRPEKTFQDIVSKDEIKKLLKNYIPVGNIFNTPIDTHIRYFSIIDGKKKFRMGGTLAKVNENKGYIVLRNGKITWSVQVKDSEFFKKVDVDDVHKAYEKKIRKYKNKIKELEKTLEEITKKIKNKKNKLN